MVAGHLREKNGYYQMVLSFKDPTGKRKTKSISTGLTVKGNKRKAEKMLDELRKTYEDEISKEDKSASDILFTEFMKEWLGMIKNSVEMSTYGSYSYIVEKRIIPYFEDKQIPLKELTPTDIQRYYTHCLLVEHVSANTVIHRHANIHKALKYAFKVGLIPYNPADRVERPRKNSFSSEIYGDKELEALFAAAKGTRLELAVILGAFYGLRRSEIVGLKWDAIDFEKKRFSIQYTVTETNIGGKQTIVEKERTKTKSSRRTLPIVEPFEKLLLELRTTQEENRRVCGRSYCTDYLEFVYVDELGQRIKPGYITMAFQKLLQKNGLKRIRFHDLRHSCASLLYAHGVSLKDIQEWLGHSTISTTANIYTHLDYSSKETSANAILNVFPTE